MEIGRHWTHKVMYRFFFESLKVTATACIGWNTHSLRKRSPIVQWPRCRLPWFLNTFSTILTNKFRFTVDFSIRNMHLFSMCNLLIDEELRALMASGLSMFPTKPLCRLQSSGCAHIGYQWDAFSSTPLLHLTNFIRPL